MTLGPAKGVLAELPTPTTPPPTPRPGKEAALTDADVQISMPLWTL